MSLAKQMYELAEAGFTVNSFFSSKDGKLSVVLMIKRSPNAEWLAGEINGPSAESDPHKKILKLLERDIAISGTPEEIEATVISELELAVEERSSISASIKEEYEKLQAEKAEKAKKKPATKKKAPAKKKPTKAELRKKAREKLEKEEGELPLFESERSVTPQKAKKELDESLKTDEEEEFEL